MRLDAGPPLRLNQVTVCCADYEASRVFYERLGFTLIVDSPPDYARFEAPGGTTLSIHSVPGVTEPGGTTIYLECDDLEGEIERLSRLGFGFEHGPVDQPWLWREARLLDPFGNCICLYRAGEYRRFPPWRVGA